MYLLLIPLLGIASCTPDPEISQPTPSITGKIQEKISPELKKLLVNWAAAHNGQQPFEKPPGITVIGDRVAIEADATEDGASLMQALERLGMTHAEHYDRIVSGQLPIAALSRLSDVSVLHYARASQFTPHTAPAQK